jgi:enoyl-CoA hydratase/carnithine racemase
MAHSRLKEPNQLSHDIIIKAQNDRITTLRLNRPQRRNALDQATWIQLAAQVAEAAGDPNCAVVILTGGPIAFAAGADISEFETVYADAVTTARFQAHVEAAMTALEACPKPVIAQISGPCVGGGCGLALACDIRFADEGAQFGITPAKLGLVYTPRDIKRVINAAGLSRAKDLLFSGRLIDAQDALRIGLIDRIVPKDQLEQVTLDYARSLIDNAPGAIGTMKQIMSLLAHDEPQALAVGNQWAAEAAMAEEFIEGRRAFLAKRRPNFRKN